METMALSHLRLKGYEEIKLPYDLYCPSVQKKIGESGGDWYQYVFSGCKKLFTTVELAKNDLKVSGNRKLAWKEPIDNCMDVDIVDEEIEICSAAPLVAINDFKNHLLKLLVCMMRMMSMNDYLINTIDFC